MKEITVKELYTLDETIAKDLFEGVTYPWEVLPKISAFILELGKTLPEEEYDKVGEDVWIAKSANVFPSAYVHGPAIIGKNAEVRHCAFIRGNAIVGEGAVVGNSTELKNVILFNKVQVPHYNYVGDSDSWLQVPHGSRFYYIQCKIRQETGCCEDTERKYRDWNQEIRRYGRRRSRSRMWIHPESGKCDRKPHQYLPAFQRARLCAGKQHLQKAG